MLDLHHSPIDLFHSRQDLEWQYIIDPAVQANLDRWHWDKTNVLYIGSMADNMVEHLVERGVSPESIVLRQTRGKYMGQISLKEGVDFERNSLDVVVADRVLHRLSEEKLISFLENTSKVLATGGQLFYIGPNPEYINRNSSFGHNSRTMSFRLLRHFNEDYHNVIKNNASQLGFSYIQPQKLMNPSFAPLTYKMTGYNYRSPSPYTAGLLMLLPEAS
jgi:hypothetical protein